MPALRRHDHPAGTVQHKPARNQRVGRAQGVRLPNLHAARRHARDLRVIVLPIVIGIPQVGPGAVLLLEQIAQAVVVKVALAVKDAVRKRGGITRIESRIVFVQRGEAVVIVVAVGVAGEDVSKQGDLPEIGQAVDILIDKDRGRDRGVGRHDHLCAVHELTGMGPVIQPAARRHGKIFHGLAEIVEPVVGHRHRAGVFEGPVGVGPQFGRGEGGAPDAQLINLPDESFAHPIDPRTGDSEGSGLGRDSFPCHNHAVDMEAQFACVDVVHARQMVPAVRPVERDGRDDRAFHGIGRVHANKPGVGLGVNKAQFVVHGIAAAA